MTRADAVREVLDFLPDEGPGAVREAEAIVDRVLAGLGATVERALGICPGDRLGEVRRWVTKWEPVTPKDPA